MLIQFSSNAAEMNRAFRRLASPDTRKPKSGYAPVAFNISSRSVEITTDGASQALAADVRREGTAFVPEVVLQGVLTTLPYFGQKHIEIGFSDGKMRVDSMIFHNPMIVLSDFHSARHRSS